MGLAFSWVGLGAHRRNPPSTLLSRPTTISDVVLRHQVHRRLTPCSSPRRSLMKSSTQSQGDRAPPPDHSAIESSEIVVWSLGRGPAEAKNIYFPPYPSRRKTSILGAGLIRGTRIH